ncbi:MAG: VCBS repeat-containing protein [Planctomycetota bacterium]
MRDLRCCLLLLLAPVVRCQEQSPFEMLGESGLEGFDARCGLPDKTHIFEVNGGGLGLEDLNGDGLLDLVAVGGSTVETLRKGEPGTRPQVFFGRGDGGFSPAGKAWELAPLPWGTGLALGDLDGDGHCDLVLASIGGLAVYRNQGGTGFEALPAPTIDGWPTSLALFDLEGDGDLDLFVVRYLKPDLRAIPAKGSGGAIWKGHPVLFGPEGLEPEADLLFLGDGTGAFTAADAALSAAPPAFGLGIVATDFDRDGDTDLYVSNDSCPNHLWRNDGGQLVEVGFASGTSHAADGREQAGMGIAVGCLGDDGTPSLFVTNFSGESNALYRPRARSGGYRERSARLGIALASHDRLGWGTGFSDIDFDGDLDLWVLNGHVYPEADWAGTDTKYAQADQVLWQGAEGLRRSAPMRCRAVGLAGWSRGRPRRRWRRGFGVLDHGLRPRGAAQHSPETRHLVSRRTRTARPQPRRPRGLDRSAKPARHPARRSPAHCRFPSEQTRALHIWTRNHRGSRPGCASPGPAVRAKSSPCNLAACIACSARDP